MITCPRCGRENAADARFCSNCGNALTEATAPAQVAEVRKVVSVLFMDAVASTAMGELSDPESVRRVMTRYFDEIRVIVERHGGTVEKYIGDAVMAVFGVPAVHEDDALRAVRAADQIRSRLALLSDEIQVERGFSVEWRTGINTGEVVAGDAGAGQRFVSGDAVNVAARLEQAAHANEILIGRETYRLVRDQVLSELVEPLQAKGKAAPLEAYRLVEVSRPGASDTRRLDAPMVGRQRQQRQLAQAFEQVVDERICYLFTILGAAGVGKSRLVAEFLSTISGQAQILHGRCLSYGEGISYWPIAEAIRGAAAIGDEDSDEQVRDKLASLVDDVANRPLVVQRLGELLGRIKGGAGSAQETFWAVRTVLGSLARRQPVVLLLDDIHWAEATLLELIENLADWTQDAPLMLLCVARQDLLESRPGWGGGKAYATTLTLEPLNERESRQLVVGLLGSVDFGPDLAEKVGAAAEGNPLFVEQMLGMLVDNGYLVREDDRWIAARDVAEVAVPPTIHALLAARLDRLPLPERAVIERGAVEGKVFHRSAVAELAPEALRDAVPDHLRALSRKELVRPDSSDFAGDEAFRFRHLLIRDAAYSAMPKEARADLHARFATWLERVAGDHVEEYEEILGYHLEQAFRYRSELGLTDDRTRAIAAAAAKHLADSGRRALERGDIGAGMKLVRAAAEIAPADWPDRFRVIAYLVQALGQAGDVRAAEELASTEAERARDAGDELGAALIEMAGLFSLTTLGRLSIESIIRRSEELLEIFKRFGDDWGIPQATIEMARHQFFAGRARRATEILESGIRRFPRSYPFARWLLSAMYWGPTPVEEAAARVRTLDVSQSRSLEAQVNRILGGLARLRGNFDAGRELIVRTLQIELELANAPGHDSVLGHFLGQLEAEAGDHETAERYLLEAFERMTARGDTGFSTTVAGHLARLYIATGQWEHAERYARVSLDTAQPDDVEAQVSGHAALARVKAHHGQFDSAEADAQRAVAVAEQTDYLETRGLALSDLGEVLFSAGKNTEAIAAFQNALRNFESKGASFHAQRVRRRLAAIESGA